MRKFLNPILAVSALATGAVFADTPATQTTTPVDLTVSAITSQAPALNPKVLKLALEAYNCAQASGYSKQKTLTVIDYSMPSTQKRMWIIDLANNKVLFNNLVAHGQGSGDVMATRFSDKSETHESSIGLYLTAETYEGHNGYSLRLKGLDKGFNDLAYSRAIVVHGARYVSDSMAKSGRIGRSWGCPAVPQKMAKPIVDTIKDGSLMFAYYPNNNWLNQSKFLHCAVNYQA